MTHSSLDGNQIPIDVRRNDEWIPENIDTAFPEYALHWPNLQNGNNLTTFMKEFQGQQVIIYCRTGVRSFNAVKLLLDSGFTGTIYNMIGGIDGWIQAGHPTKANSPPSMPVISGESNGNIGQQYSYSFTATDVDQDDVYYLINWSDNTSDQLVGPYHAGEEVSISHSWSEKGTYTIKAKARDIYYSESDWSALEVTMPKTKVSIFIRFC